MKINRLTITNFRGVTSAEVTFPSVGVTVIEGDNEAGKSSLAEALSLLFEFRDDTKNRRIKAVQPVHRDVGPEVEVDLTTGPYRICYAKRWLRQAQTTLTVLEPERAQLTGREAHERVQAILAETLDGDLWRALRLEQGADLEQVDYAVPSLGRALDLAAGDGQDDLHNDALWDRIVDQRDQYWTATGQASKDRKQLADRVREAEDRVRVIEGELRELEVRTDRIARLEAEAIELAVRQRELEQGEAEQEARLSVVEELGRQVAQLAAERDAASADHQRWVQLRDARDELVSKELDQSARLTAAEERRASAEPAAAEAGRVVSTLRDEYEAAARSVTAAEEVLRGAVGDTDFRRQQIEVEQFIERRDRVRLELEAVAGAEEVLESNRIDSKVMAEFETAYLAQVRAEASAAGGAVRLTATALSDLEVVSKDSAHRLAVGDSRQILVVEDSEVSIPGTVVLNIEVGPEAKVLHDDLQRAEADLARLCADYGVADLVEARAAAAARSEAERIHSGAAGRIQQDLRDLTLEDLERKITRHTERIATYEAERTAEPEIPIDLDAAQEISRRAEGHLADLRSALAEVQSALADATAAMSEAAVNSAGLAAQVDAERDALDRIRTDLAQAREMYRDLDLTGGLEASRAVLEVAQSRWSAHNAELNRADLEMLRQVTGNARTARQSGAERIRANQREHDALSAVLEAQGENGLANRLDAAITERGHLRAELERIENRAAVALLLHDTFAARRAAARARYQAPFRDKLEQLARLVFGPSLELALDDDLQVMTRTLDGITVSFDQLSTGAREQLGVLSRLACAMLVAEDGGAPVILDDTLGWTDATRLTQMAAAISLAGRRCQVVVLTCNPGRFAGIGGAHVVRLHPHGAVGSDDGVPAGAGDPDGQSLLASGL